MKKISLSIATLFSLIAFVSAQNSSPYWSLAGNSNTTSSSKLGTTNGINLRLVTNNSERVRITTSGLVGIGTTSPLSRLHVNSSSGQDAIRAQVNGSTKFIVHSNGSVGIGTTSPSFTNKLHVVNSSSTGTGIYTTGYTGLYASSINTYGYGVSAYSDQGYAINASSNNIAVNAYGGSSGYGIWSQGLIGVYGDGGIYGTSGYSYAGTGAYGLAYEGLGVSGGSTNGYGGNFSSYNSYGIVAATTNGDYAGVFYGKVYTSAEFVASDKNLKTNIHGVGDAMSIIKKLKPQNYEFKKDAKFASLNLPKGIHFGLMAQDLEQVLPNLVSEATHELKTVKPTAVVKPGADGKPAVVPIETKQAKETMNIKAVNYTELISIVIKGMQELSKENEDLKKQNENFQQQIDDLQALVQSITKQGGSITSHSKAFLMQNAPNPVNDNTIISYFTPEDTRNAQLLVSDMKGRVLKALTLSKGEGQVTLRKGELPSGTYQYTLYVNSNKIDSKRMVIVK